MEESKKILQESRESLKEAGQLLKEVEDLLNRINALKEDIEADFKPIEVKKDAGRGITLYRIGGETFLSLPELMSLIKTEKKLVMEGTEHGYINPDREQRISAMLALNHLQTVILRNRLDNAHTPDEIREVSMEARKHKTCPGRYVLERIYPEDGHPVFFAGYKAGKTILAGSPEEARKFITRKAAETAIDMIDYGGDEWEVADSYDTMTAEDRLLYAIYAPTEE